MKVELKKVIALISKRSEAISKDLETLTKAKRLLGDDVITNKYSALVDIKCELALLRGEIGDLLD